MIVVAVFVTGTEAQSRTECKNAAAAAHSRATACVYVVGVFARKGEGGLVVTSVPLCSTTTLLRSRSPVLLLLRLTNLQFPPPHSRSLLALLLVAVVVRRRETQGKSNETLQ